ncbi:hypothetical protein [Parasphingorhabdus sp.]|uniref:hypothetical protein n=1 Tax=Parasphingorhabdus sp. TaxID=2709688 RepID=UPI003C73F3B0
MTDALIFPNHDGIGGTPSVDGFFDLDYMITGETPESGYIGGSALTIGASGIPPVEFRGIRNGSNGRIVMGFLCRFSGSFDDDNGVVIVVKPTHASVDQADQRKIHIKPLQDGTGAGPGVGTGAPNEIKTNIDPEDVDYYRGDGSGGWTQYSSQTNTDIKVRSWKPTIAGGSPDEFAWSVEISLPMTATEGGPDWIDLTNDFGLYFSVIKIVPVGGGAVAEYVFPLTAPVISGFPVALYTPTVFGHGLVPDIAGPPLPNISAGVQFVNDWQGVGRRAAGSGSLTLGSTIEAAVNGVGDDLDNELVALIENTGSSAANSIRAEFRMKNWGLPPATFPEWDTPLGLQPNPTDPENVAASATNVALVSDWPIIPNPPSVPTNQVPIEYQTHRHQCMWVQLSAASQVYFHQSSVRRNMNFEQLSEVKREAEVSGEGYPEPANGTGDHDFLLQTFCRQIVVQELVDNPKNIDPETVTLVRNTLVATGALDRGTDDDKDDKDTPQNDGRNVPRDVVATHMVNRMAATAGARAGGSSQFKDSIVYIWTTEGFRMTDKTITIGNNTYPVLDNGCGTFGIAAHHKGVKDPLSWEFSGKGMSRFKPGLYALKVPHGGVTTIGIRLAADKGGPRGDQSKDLPRIKELPPQKPGGGKPGGGNGGKPEKGGCLGVLLIAAAVPVILMGASWLSGVS